MKIRTLAVCGTIVLAGLPARAQDAAHTEPTALKVHVVFNRYQGEKKISSAPYTLSLTTDDRSTRLRMGIRVPFPSAAKVGESVSYQNVGNNVDCAAHALSEGRFWLTCSFEQSSLYTREDEPVPQRMDPSAPPLLRTFSSQANMILRDGQTTQHTAAMDPINGDILKVDVTLNVVR